MSLFANDSQPSAPVWAGFFSIEQYARFLGHVHDYLRENHIEATIQEGLITIPAGNHKLGLHNLAQLCFHSPEERWHTLIFSHLTRVLASTAKDEILAQATAPYEEVADKLAIRMWPKAILEATNASELVTREYIPDIISVLVYDNPESISTVGWSTIKNWDLSLDDIFERALANVKRDMPPKITKVQIEEGAEVTVFLSENFFMTTHALFLDGFEDCIGTFGSLVGIPHRHALLCFPIDDVSVVNVLSNLVIAVHNMHGEGPGSISPFLYWYTGGEYIQLPHEIDDNQLTFLPPPEFIDLLDKIARAN
ncbi:MAG: hypothetical protein ACPG8W_00775 [Candidatus Promineifilaceae bacterium]